MSDFKVLLKILKYRLKFENIAKRMLRR